MQPNVQLGDRVGFDSNIAGHRPIEAVYNKEYHPKGTCSPGRAGLWKNIHGYVGYRLIGKLQGLMLEILDHMLSIEWTASDGWLPPRITPYQNLSLDPATCVFHYAFECFEGMKAYKASNGQIRLFRPDKNMARLNYSSARIALPTVEPTALIKLISQFVTMEERFIPA